MRNEKTSKALGSIASKALKNPKSISQKDVRRLAGSVLTQRPDKKK